MVFGLKDSFVGLFVYVNCFFLFSLVPVFLLGWFEAQWVFVHEKSYLTMRSSRRWMEILSEHEQERYKIEKRRWSVGCTGWWGQRMLAWNFWLLVIHVCKCETKLVYSGSSFCVLWFCCFSDMGCREIL